MTDLDVARMETFARLLLEGKRSRVHREAIWKAFATAFPGRPQSAEQRRWLRAALDDLAHRELIRLPSAKGTRWDRTLDVAVPEFIDIVRSPRPRRPATWRTHAWHPRLQWVSDLVYLPPDHEDLLLRVHDGLVNRRFERLAPLKYRSLQLTGHEKRLARFLDTQLFAPGRLDLQLLGCASETLPLAWEEVGKAPRALVLENAGPFAVAREVLSRLADPPYGIVAYGGGRGFELSVGYLATLKHDLTSIDYVGDLDRPGLSIPLAASAVAAGRGLPPVTPAPGMHRAMLESAGRFGRPKGWKQANIAPGPYAADASLLAWLAPDVRADAGAVLEGGRRIPEEVLGTEEFEAAILESDESRR